MLLSINLFVKLPVQGVLEPGLAGVTAGVIDGGRPGRIHSHKLLTVPVLILLKPECHIPDRADLAKAGVILDQQLDGDDVVAVFAVLGVGLHGYSARHSRL